MLLWLLTAVAISDPAAVVNSVPGTRVPRVPGTGEPTVAQLSRCTARYKCSLKEYFVFKSNAPNRYLSNFKFDM
eukprot:127619-Rhodomonas_salina.2